MPEACPAILTATRSPRRTSSAGPSITQDGVARFDTLAVVDGRPGVDAEVVEHRDGGVQSGDDARLFGDEATRRLAGNLVRHVVVAQVLSQPPSILEWGSSVVGGRFRRLVRAFRRVVDEVVGTEASSFSSAWRVTSSATTLAWRSSYSEREVRVRTYASTSPFSRRSTPALAGDPRDPVPARDVISSITRRRRWAFWWAKSSGSSGRVRAAPALR